MQIKTLGKVVLLVPESTEDSMKIEANLIKLVDAGYGIEKRKWGGLIVSDSSIRFKWEVVEVQTDVKRLLQLT